MGVRTKNKNSRIIYLTLLIVAGVVLVSPFFISIFFAATIALAMFPLLLKLETKGISRKYAAAMLTTLFTLVISIPFMFFVMKGTVALTAALEKFQASEYKQQGVASLVRTLRHDLVDAIHGFSSKYQMLQFIDEQKIEYYLNTVTTFLLKFFQGVITGLPVIFLLFLVMIVCIFSFLKHASGVREFFESAFGFTRPKMDELVVIFMNDTRQVYVANILTGACQSIVVATGVSLTGQADFFLVFFITLILSFIPVIGAAPVAFVFALVAFFKDQVTVAIILGCVGAFTGIVDNFLRPYFNSLGSSQVPAIISFVCVIGGALLLGFPGLFVGILIGNIAYDTVPFFWREINKQEDDVVIYAKDHPVTVETQDHH